MQFCAKAEHTQLSTSQPAAHTDLQIYTHIQGNIEHKQKQKAYKIACFEGIYTYIW